MSKEDLEKEIAKGNVSPIAFYNPDGSNMLYTQKYVEEKEKEIERLNNIIEELEKYLYTICIGEATFEERGITQSIIQRLNELKEGKK